MRNSGKSVLFAFDDENSATLVESSRPDGSAGRNRPEGYDAAQRSAAMALVASALSPRGFEKVQQIMEGDEVNKTSEGNGPPFGRGPGGPPPRGPNGPRPPFDRGGNGGQMFGKDLYYISILGTPSEKNPWMLQFGGHHLALNITIAGERGILTPTLTGAQPALYTVNGKTVRPLGQESDKALALLNALDESQRKQAILKLPCGRSGARSRAGRQNDPARGSEGLQHEREAARHAAGRDLGMGRHHSRKRGAARMAELKAGSQRDLVRLERPNHGRSG